MKAIYAFEKTKTFRRVLRKHKWHDARPTDIDWPIDGGHDVIYNVRASSRRFSQRNLLRIYSRKWYTTTWFVCPLNELKYAEIESLACYRRVVARSKTYKVRTNFFFVISNMEFLNNNNDALVITLCRSRRRTRIWFWCGFVPTHTCVYERVPSLTLIYFFVKRKRHNKIDLDVTFFINYLFKIIFTEIVNSTTKFHKFYSMVILNHNLIVNTF